MDVVLFETLDTANGKKIGIATLNSERSLNALSLPMVELLQPQLNAWRDDPSIVCVWLQGAGEKAFCAGGDIVAMYKAMVAKPGEYVDEVETFFTREYELDYLIHTYPKPFVVWGHGIVMGGGMGLLNGASHRIVTERSRLAMPEITIGLYPDVGGTYFLNEVPQRLGLFLGLTAASVNAADACFLNLADYFVPSAEKQGVLDKLRQLDWGEGSALNKQKLTDVLTEAEHSYQQHLPQPVIKPWADRLEVALRGNELATVVESLLALSGDEPWLAKAQQALRHGCPLTAHIVWNQLNHGASLSLAECFQLELTLSVNCAVKGDFAEGIRALLIDKDNQPQWSYSSVADVPPEAVDAMFESPWPQVEHPLHHLTGLAKV